MDQQAETITDTQLICRLLLYFGTSTILSIFLQWICMIRQVEAAGKIEENPYFLPI